MIITAITSIVAAVTLPLSQLMFAKPYYCSHALRYTSVCSYTCPDFYQAITMLHTLFLAFYTYHLM